MSNRIGHQGGWRSSGVNTGRLQLRAKVEYHRLALESGNAKLDKLARTILASKLFEQFKRLSMRSPSPHGSTKSIFAQS